MKFAVFDSSVHVRFSLRPLDFCFFSGEVPGGTHRTEQIWRGGSRRWGWPAARGSGGKVRGAKAAPNGGLGSPGGERRRRFHGGAGTAEVRLAGR